MADLFAYGTLMCEDIMQEVSGCRLSFVQGIVKGYCRRSVRGEVYPAITPDEAGVVAGVVYHDLTGPAWDRLDQFEGDMYARKPVTVETVEGVTLQAETYIVRVEFLSHLDSAEWSFERFLRNGKKRFQNNYFGYEKL